MHTPLSFPGYLPLKHFSGAPHSVVVAMILKMLLPNSSPQLSEAITVRKPWGAGGKLDMCHLVIKIN